MHRTREEATSQQSEREGARVGESGKVNERQESRQKVAGERRESDRSPPLRPSAPPSSSASAPPLGPPHLVAACTRAQALIQTNAKAARTSAVGKRGRRTWRRRMAVQREARAVSGWTG